MRIAATQPLPVTFSQCLWHRAGRGVVLESPAGSAQAPPGCLLAKPLSILFGSLDAAILSGRYDFEGVMGREGLLQVTAVGEGVDPGFNHAKVVVDAAWGCGDCVLCCGGISYLCARRVTPGVPQTKGSADLAGRSIGGLATPDAVVPASAVVAVPAGLDPARARLAQTLGAAVHTVRLARLDAKDYVTIIGDGPMGVLCAQVAATLSPFVRLLGKHPERFTLLERVGIRHRHVSEVGRRADQQVVIDCTGDARGVPLASQLLAARGRLIVKASPLIKTGVPSGPEQSEANARLTRLECTLQGAAGGFVRDGLAFLRRYPIDPDLVISRSLPAAHAQHLHELLLDRRNLLVSVDWKL